MIYILLSIKTRIETVEFFAIYPFQLIFISYYPLKQGLKREYSIRQQERLAEFISYYPLKQGLKLCRTGIASELIVYLYPTIH